jgi:hypothetical protein
MIYNTMSSTDDTGSVVSQAIYGFMNCYTVFKRTATHADALAAIGAADVLRHLEPRIVELEDRFEIRLRKTLRAEDLASVDPGFSYLERPKNDGPALPPERIMRARARSGGLAGVPCAHPSDNRMYTILARLKAYAGPNKVVAEFAKIEEEEWATSIWNGLEGRHKFVFRAPLVQLFNPHSAKGYALLKPNSTNRSDKTKDRWAEPFLEWLRFRGYFEGCAGWFTHGDLRLYCPIPGDIGYDQFARTAASFREVRLGGTAVKMDCRAVLGLTRLLVENTETYRPPRQVLRGIWVTHYKDMGQAHTFMALEQLAIPDWFSLRTASDTASWLRTLDEHETIVRRLTDSHSDEFSLLKQYRGTFQVRWQESVEQFLEFLAAYGCHLLRTRGEDHWSLPQFMAAGVIAMVERDARLRSMARNPGLRAVAATIRSCTVGAQSARHNARTNHREIRYGLLTEIRRAGLSGKHELASRVFSFVSAFNQEGARRRSAGIRSRSIQSQELEAFRTLLDDQPTATSVSSLLCALATCRNGRAAAEEVEAEMFRAIPA